MWDILNEFVKNLQVCLSAKELWKSVNIWESYGQEFIVLFFDSTHSVRLQTYRERWIVQWYGNLVTHRWYNDIWLTEGLATFYNYYPLEAIGWPAVRFIEPM